MKLLARASTKSGREPRSVEEEIMHRKIAGRTKVVSGWRFGATLMSAGLLAAVLTPSSAQAGLTVTCGPTYSQSQVMVGEVLTTATLLIVNTSDGAQGMAPIAISNLRHTPACGNSGAGVDAVHSCDAANDDPGVFGLAASAAGIAPPGPNGAPATATACIGRTFTVSVIDADTDEVRLTPDMAIVLQPPGMPGSGCLIQFSSIEVLKLPTHDVSPSPGAMTNQLCRVTATQEDLTITNGGLGQVTAEAPAQPPGGVPVMGHVALSLVALALAGGGAYMLRRRKRRLD